jgi:hypothetical protein
MYTIVSPRVGTPGEEYTPTDGVNIDALIQGGFIVETSKPKAPKSDKVTPNKES